MTAPTVVQALSAVMEDVQAVKKASRNTQQNFNFRGIDAVVNAVGPALRKHGVVVVPTSVQSTVEQYETKSGTAMRNTTLAVGFRFYGPAGDFIDAQAMGEAADAGDKSVPKAHSVAFRTLLLQALCIPTDEPDSDSTTHERAVAPPADPRVALRSEIKRLGEARGWSIGDIGDDFAQWSQGQLIPEADAPLLAKYRNYLKSSRDVLDGATP